MQNSIKNVKQILPSKSLKLAHVATVLNELGTLGGVLQFDVLKHQMLVLESALAQFAHEQCGFAVAMDVGTD